MGGLVASAFARRQVAVEYDGDHHRTGRAICAYDIERPADIAEERPRRPEYLHGERHR
jgi:hypothetical protein